MCHIYNTCIKHKQVPTEWNTSMTIFFPKTHFPDDISDWRPIALSRTMYKIYADLLMERSWCRVHEVISPTKKYSWHITVFSNTTMSSNRELQRLDKTMSSVKNILKIQMG